MSLSVISAASKFSLLQEALSSLLPLCYYGAAQAPHPLCCTASMESSPLQPLADSHFKPEGKAVTVNIFGALALGRKELSKKIAQGIQKTIGFDVHQAKQYPPSCTDVAKPVYAQKNDVGFGGRGDEWPPFVQPAKTKLRLIHSQAISFFKSRRDMGAPVVSAPNPALNEGFVSVKDEESKACIRKQGSITTFSGFLAIALCIVAITIPYVELFLESSNAEDGANAHVHLGSYWWAIRLCGLLATCLCLLGFAWLGEGKRSRDCDCCHDAAEMSVNRALEAEQKACQANRAKQQFMTYIFHNIRVPFNAIVLGLGYLRSKADKQLSSSEVTESIDLIQMMLDCAETMTSVLDDVTDLGQWEDGVMELNLEEFDLLGLVKFLLWGLKDLLYQKQMCFSMNIDPIVKAVLSSNHVLGDKHRVLQTLGNFLSNAVKFSPAGGRLELSIKCEEVVKSDACFPCKSGVPIVRSDRAQDCSLCPGLRVEGLRKLPKDLSKPSPIHACCGQGSFAKVIITVKDTSNGISAEDQAKMFEPYSFVSSGWVQKAGVSGLGLSMAKRFAEQSGGYIGVESKEGEGSMFYFCLPYPLIPITYGVEYKSPSKDEWPDAFMMEESEGFQGQSVFGKRERVIVEEAKVVCSAPAIDGGRQKVLLVEDTEINRIILKKVLQNLNLSCEEAENGQVAVDFLKQGRMYDLILMDKEMPVMDGHEATRQLRLMGVKTPIVALTGNSLQSDRELFLEAGVDDFQTKPLSRDKLVQVLARFGMEISCA